MVAARRPDATEAREALATLCEAYWYPLYNFVRRRGHRPDEAADLVQGYFVQLLDKGYLGDVAPYTSSFRAFLLASIKNFLSNERDKARALKRGGHLRQLPLDGEQQATERVDSFRADDLLTVDLRLEKEFAAGRDLWLTVGLDGFNVFDASAVLQRDTALNTGTTGWIEETLTPRVWRLGVRLGWR